MSAEPRAAFWKWLTSAPLPVVLFICLTSTSAVAGWVWTIADATAAQSAAVAVAAEQAKTAKADVQDTKEAMIRMETKLDRLLEAVANLKAAEAARDRKEKK